MMADSLPQNIKKAKEEIARLEEEAAEAENRSTDQAKKPAIENNGVNGKVSATAELKQEKDAAADVSDELQKASLEEKA